MDTYECVVIGAGLSGLLGAKTYLDVYPSARVLILESQETVGGVWAKERTFPGLHLQSSTSVFGFPELDWETIDPPVSRNKRGFPTSESVHRYMDAFAAKFKLHDRTRFNSKVVQVNKLEGINAGWEIFTESTKDENEKHKYRCEKLMVATGLASNAIVPDLPREDFKPHVWHTKDMGKYQTHLISHKVTKVAVYGGGKSSYDAVMALNAIGKQVTWIIRKSGRGPGWLINPFTGNENSQPVDPLMMTRIASFLMPICYKNDGYTWTRWFMNQTVLGRWITRTIFSFALTEATKQMGEINENVQKIAPEPISPLWGYSVLGANNYEEDVFTHVREGKINVIRDDIVSLTNTSINFSASPSITTDAIVLCTGYEHRFSFFSSDLEYTFGLPSTNYTPAQTSHWQTLDKQAVAAINKYYPLLAHPPPHRPPPVSPKPRTPERLWRFMVPPTMATQGDYSLVFLGEPPQVGTLLAAAVTSIWAVAYLSGKLPIPDDIEFQTAYEVNFVQKRIIGAGSNHLGLGLDSLPYCTQMLTDVGLDPFMKKGWWKEISSPYLPQDFVGLAQKWMTKEKMIVEADKTK